MTSLIKIYDDFSSKTSVSLAINIVSTGYMIFSATLSPFAYVHKLTFAISVCAGIAFGLLAKNYIIDHRVLTNRGEKNSAYVSLLLINFLYSFHLDPNSGYLGPLRDYIFTSHNKWYELFLSCTNSPTIAIGLKVGFTTTLLFQQLKELN